MSKHCKKNLCLHYQESQWNQIKNSQDNPIKQIIWAKFWHKKGSKKRGGGTSNFTMGSLLTLIEVYTEKVQFSKSFGDIVALCWLSDYLINIHLLDSMYNPGLPLCQFQVKLVFEAKESLAMIWVFFFCFFLFFSSGLKTLLLEEN